MTRIRRLFDQPPRQQGRDLAAKGSPRRDTAHAILASLLANATTTTLRRTVDAVSLFPRSARSAPRRPLRRLHLRPKAQDPQRPYGLRVLQTMTIVRKDSGGTSFSKGEDYTLYVVVLFRKFVSARKALSAGPTGPAQILPRATIHIALRIEGLRTRVFRRVELEHHPLRVWNARIRGLVQ